MNIAQQIETAVRKIVSKTQFSDESDVRHMTIKLLDVNEHLVFSEKHYDLMHSIYVMNDKSVIVLDAAEAIFTKDKELVKKYRREFSDIVSSSENRSLDRYYTDAEYDLYF